MSWFRKKKKCPNGHTMEPSWDSCPYCAQAQRGEKTRYITVDREHPVVGWLVALNGPQKGMDFRVTDGEFSIGASRNCDIFIDDEFISDPHAKIKYEGGTFVINDLGSKNKTYVNDVEVTRKELIDNDKVKMGKTEFRFKCL